MQDFSLLFLGSVFISGSFVVYYYGHKKDTNNALLWAFFPFFHGLHEFVDFYSEISTGTVFIRLEVFLAIISSLVLLAVCIEFLGTEHSRYGKLTSLLLLVLFSYFLFVIPDDVFNELYNINHNFIWLQTSFFQFIYGILFIFIALIAIEYNLVIIKRENERTSANSSFIKYFLIITPISMILFIIFEGFIPSPSLFPNNSLGYQLFAVMEAICAFLFLLIPIIFMTLSKPGLNSLIAFIPEDGRFIFTFDFVKKKLITAQDKSIDQWINTASFLSALTLFSTTEGILGGMLSSVNTEKGVFILSKSENFSLALNTRTTTNNLKNSLRSFLINSKPIIDEIIKNTLEIQISKNIELKIIEEFTKYM